jgi:vacuolar-type H+-ATPase subunit H
VSANHHAKDQAQELIMNLVDREQALAAQVENARAEADAMARDAATKAQSVLKSAEQDIGARRKAFEEKTSAMTRQVRDEKLADARRQLEQLEQRGAANAARAAAAVVKYVMPESD